MECVLLNLFNMFYIRSCSALSVFVFSMLVLITAEAQILCSEIFQTPKTSLSNLDRLIFMEEQLSSFSQRNEAILNDPLISQRYEVLQREFLKAEGLLGSSNESELLVVLTKMSVDLDQLNSYAFALRQSASADFTFLMENPLLLRPGLSYSIQSMDPHLRRISFSKNVLENVFWSDHQLMHRAVPLIYKSLLRGRQHATDSAGVIAFANDRSVFKIKISGHAVGALRLAGFYIGEDLHIVAWSQESKHNEHASARLVENVQSARERYLRSNHY